MEEIENVFNDLTKDNKTIMVMLAQAMILAQKEKTDVKENA